MPLLAMQPPPALTAPAPAPPTAQEAESALLEAYDWGRPLPVAPKLKGQALLRYRWLRAAATFDPAIEGPPSPFAGGPERREAEALGRLLKLAPGDLPTALKALPLKQPGTALALWRWGQAQMRRGAFNAPLRRLWEDRLLGAGPALTRGYALRHALCWCLADQDDQRLSALRKDMDADSEEVIRGVQRLFGLLGGPSPALRLWELPGLAYRDLGLDQLGARRIWISPLEEGPLPALGADTAWILPSESGGLDEREASLSEGLLQEAKNLAARLPAQPHAYFAPSRAAFERLGLAWFPILIELDAKGNLRSVHMGDAAPKQP